ncbi:protease [Pseudovirgaria hyperparasitica]|uniref:Protease n=1 Tax=Pseudovirgaria hyperparasitica TaxID=470096 RepID=A0A6A6W087_9PEZI|nr:protease [Pseudovirgaria hyperparasitica]KAF2755506.1 protease [Pseudovirgaria hyperparasitica]
MADERTPLIQVIQIRPATPRYSHHTLRRFCSLVLTVVPILVLASLLLGLFLPDHLDDGTYTPSPYLPGSSKHIPQSWPQSSGLSYEELEGILIDIPDPKKAKEWSKYYTAGPHLAGKNLSQAVWTKDRWEEFGVASKIVSYDCYLNYPVAHRLALLEKSKKKHGLSTEKKDSWEVKFEATLEEDVLDEDSTSGLEDRIPTFHGYSASGNVTAPYVYVNYGTVYDYQDLVDANVTLSGKIALARYGGVFRGLKVKRAQELGMVGVIMYTDPGDDGGVTEENGDKPYPHGLARQESSVQRGSVQFLSMAPGDPTTPGYPSLPGAERKPVDHAIPSIPSLPISYKEALPLLKALNGYGPKASKFNKFWQGGGLGYKGVDYNIGPTPDDLVINLSNEQDYQITPLWNVIGIINGTIADEVIVLGNHRDAWIAGGAGDPNSGSAAMNEVVRSFGTALDAGWKPLRTIVFASWDGEEYGLIGSTEWVEEYLPWLQTSTVAYLNVDVGTSGPHLHVASAPLLNTAFVSTLSKVQSPNQTVVNQTLADLWDGKIATMGSGSDFTAFQDFAGIPSIDMGFQPGEHSAVYHYHSNYDSFSWMQKFGDPSFQYHATIARVWALLAAKLVETPVLALNATEYATGLSGYLERAKKTAQKGTPAKHASIFEPIEQVLTSLYSASVKLDQSAADLGESLKDPPPAWKWWERVRLYYLTRKVNTKYKTLERQFLHEEGLDGRSWFKHVVFAPGIWTGYAGATFPGLVESIEAGDWDNAEKWVGIIVKKIEAATALLDGGK